MEKIKEVSFTAENGYEYMLTFVEEPNLFQIEIITISILLLDKKTTSLSLKDIFSIGKIFKDFLRQKQNRVLTYVCDSKPLLTSKRNETLTPQLYRNKLFDAIFNKLNNDAFFKRDVTLGKGKDKQYLSFIGLSEYETIVNECASLVIEKLED